MLSFSFFLLLALKIALIIAFIYFTFVRKRQYTILPEHPIILIINILGILYLTELLTLLMLYGIHRQTWELTLAPAIHDIFIPVGIVIIYLTLIRPYITKQHDNIDLINDNIQEAIIVMDLGGNIYYINKAAEKMFGYTKKESHKIKSSALLSLPDMDNNASWISLKNLTGQNQLELEGHRKDGKNFPVRVMINSVITGKKVIFVSIIQDVSEQKKAEHKLQKIAQQFRDFFYLNPEACTIATMKGRLIDVNQATLDLSEYSKEELIGKNVNDIQAWLNQEDQLRIFRELVQKGKINSRETTFRKKSGNISKALYSAQIIEVDGEKMILSITRDITERKEMEESLKQAKEEAETANRAKSDFLAHMSHEIRTPMNTTLGAAELLSETKLSSEQQQYVDMFKRSSEHLLSLINDILDLSKIEAGHLELEYIDFDICKLCDELIDIMKVKAKDKNLYLKYTTLLTCPTYLIGDQHRLNQILINLVGNAIKFTQSGGITISIEPSGNTGDKNNTELLFKVSDTGIGVPTERTNTIFQSFSQGDTSTSRQYGGTGLGLSISKKLVELMNGKIWVESTHGKGSTFCFTAVFGVSEQTYRVPEKIPETKKAHLKKGLSILLVDDSEDNREIIKLYLRDQPVNIEMANNGIEAVDKVKTNRYDVILMDLQMPIMDGYAATEAIREWEKANNKEKTPIIALSANAFREHQKRALEVGCDNYIIKPVKKGKLIEILATI